jgi:serine/threonine-protein kinase
MTMPQENQTESEENARLRREAEGLVGQTLSDRYLVESVLGVGGMGAVYQAEHLLMHKRVAIKVLHREMTQLPEAVQRFEREAIAAGHIEHPNVVAARDFGKLPDGAFFLVLDFIEGTSLREQIDRCGPFPVARAVRVARQILLGLMRAHGLGIVHRDLKPENVMLVQGDDGPDQVKMLDFGIAKMAPSDRGPLSGKGSTTALTRMGMVYGTPEYMAPEQALGQEVDHRADLYALGVLLFEMLAGRRPFVADNPVQILGQVVSMPVPPLAQVHPSHQVPPEVEEVARVLLAKVPSDRFPDARAALAALDAAYRSDSVPGAPGALPSGSIVPSQPLPTTASSALGTEPSPPPLRHWAPLQDRRVLAGLGAGVLALVAVVAVGLGGRGEQPSGAQVASASASVALSSEPPPPPPPLSDEEIQRASGQGLEALVALRERAPKDPRVLLAVARFHAQQRKVEEALAAFGALFEVTQGASPEALQSLVQLVQGEKKPEPILESLGKAGAGGMDVLYEFSRNPKVPAAVRTKALGALLKGKEGASPELALVLQLRDVTSVGPKAVCGQAGRLKALLAEAKSKGDGRALPYLLPMQGSGGCSSWGGLKKQDCYACLRGDSLLSDAIGAIRSREKAEK